MVAPIAALVTFAALFALATTRRVHLGVLMFAGACAVGLAVRIPLRQVVAGFPVGILLLVAGVTYFFGIAQLNGTVDLLLSVMVRRGGGGRHTAPALFFALSAMASGMGSPQAGLATGPIGMPFARRAGVDSALMAIAINSGISVGSFAPTSLFGIVTLGVARQARIDVKPFVLLAVALAANLLLLTVAVFLFPNRPVRGNDPARAVPDAMTDSSGGARVSGLTTQQVLTLACMVALAGSIAFAAVTGVEIDIGAATLGLGAILAVVDPVVGSRAFARIDWSTAFVVGGIVTYVGVLQSLDAVDLLGRTAMQVGTPVAAAVLVCMLAALVSAFASTTAVLAGLVPLAVPLAASGEIAGWALITALGVCATIVDASPFSNTGATLIASTAEQDRPRLRTMLLWWGMSMVIVGPIVLVPVLLLIGR